MGRSAAARSSPSCAVSGREFFRCSARRRGVAADQYVLVQRPVSRGAPARHRPRRERLGVDGSRPNAGCMTFQRNQSDPPANRERISVEQVNQAHVGPDWARSGASAASAIFNQSNRLLGGAERLPSRLSSASYSLKSVILTRKTSLKSSTRQFCEELLE